MKKKQLREWRNNLVCNALLQFGGLPEKKNKKLRKLLEHNMDDAICYYWGLLPKKERKKLTMQSAYLATSNFPPE